jgi:hypothetical protein
VFCQLGSPDINFFLMWDESALSTSSLKLNYCTLKYSDKTKLRSVRLIKSKKGWIVRACNMHGANKYLKMLFGKIGRCLVQMRGYYLN